MDYLNGFGIVLESFGVHYSDPLDSYFFDVLSLQNTQNCYSKAVAKAVVLF
jgi:hypothetical protein